MNAIIYLADLTLKTDKGETDIKKVLLHDITFNSAWILLEKGLRVIINIYVLGLVASYLGVEKFGLYSYCLTLFLIMEPLATLGLKDIVKREISNNPEERSAYIGTATSLRLLAALTIFLGVYLFGNTSQDFNSQIMPLLTIFLTGYFFRYSEPTEAWFELELKSKVISLVKTFAFLISSVLKIYGVVQSRDLIFFVYIYAIELMLIGLLTEFFFKKYSGRFIKFNLDFNRIKFLLSQSWPLIFSSIAITIYMKIDQLMLKSMVDVLEVGHYAPAVRLSEIWYFIPLSLAASFFGKIIEAKKSGDEEGYKNKLQLIFCFMTYLALPISIGVYFLAPYVVPFIFGTKYNFSAQILQIHIWSSIFVFWGCAQGPWNIAENQTKHFLFRTVFGAITNIGLNYFLISRQGAFGAAWATLVSYWLSNHFLNLFGSKTREIFWLQLKSFNPKPILNYLKN